MRCKLNPQSGYNLWWNCEILKQQQKQEYAFFFEIRASMSFISYLVTMEINDPINKKYNFFFIWTQFGSILSGRSGVEDDQELVGVGHDGLQHDTEVVTLLEVFHNVECFKMIDADRKLICIWALATTSNTTRTFLLFNNLSIEKDQHSSFTFADWQFALGSRFSIV